jgi:hypothetical protein
MLFVSHNYNPKASDFYTLFILGTLPLCFAIFITLLCLVSVVIRVAGCVKQFKIIKNDSLITSRRRTDA